MAQLVKNPPAVRETGLQRSPGEGKGHPLQYSGLENSIDCIVHGVTKSRTRLSDFHFRLAELMQYPQAWSSCVAGQPPPACSGHASTTPLSNGARMTLTLGDAAHCLEVTTEKGPFSVIHTRVSSLSDTFFPLFFQTLFS